MGSESDAKTKIFVLLVAISSVLSSCTGNTTKNPDSYLNVASGRVIRIDSLPSVHVQSRPIDIWIPDGVMDYGDELTEQASTAGEATLSPPSPADSSVANYTPPKVIYMTDGQMLFDGAITWNGAEWRVDEVVSRKIADGSIDPVIIVGVHNNQEFRRSEYFPEAVLRKLSLRDRVQIETTQLKGKALGDAYLSYLVEEVKPYVDRRFKPAQGPENTFVMGSSMGGVFSLYATLERPDVFGRVGALSTHWPLLDEAGRSTIDEKPLMEAFLSYLMEKIPRANSGTHAFYFDRGTEGLDSLYAPMQIAVDRIMVEKGYYRANWRSLIYPDADHNENAWSERFEIPLDFLLNADPAGAAELMRRAEEKQGQRAR